MLPAKVARKYVSESEESLIVLRLVLRIKYKLVTPGR